MKQLQPVILASGSPRRKELLASTGIRFDVIVREVDETYPDTLPPNEVALFLAQKKSSAYVAEVNSGNIVITADTVVSIEDRILNKPRDVKEATEMLQLLSGKAHRVITGVCLRGRDFTECFQVITVVVFRTLALSEIRYYIENFRPFDKAGAYGIQEWIGLTGIEKIDGSYFNVVGLPVKEVYDKLLLHGIISLE